MPECRKCHRPLHPCDACNGGRPGTSLLGDKLQCKNCQSTGRVCDEHGGHWE